MDAWVDGYLNSLQTQIMAVVIYNNQNQLVSGRFIYPYESQMVCNVMNIQPDGIVPSLFTEQGTEYLKTNGVNFNDQRMRFINMDEKDDEGQQIIILAGKSDKDTPWIPAGAFVYKTPNQSTIAVCYGPEQPKGVANEAAFKIVEALKGTGY
ncbi:Profilin [Spironucleus salmonicida]|uniref:Profilin n=1 Tax=Spironucleus salmonicida TaxID=348837 RepID=V6LV91_9EUKA|nr:Profilin [Spironucleus salmonicida]|eukprot:EST47631.1 Hypothetical protein SS50377_12325 [Spironucleus salmonicida]